MAMKKQILTAACMVIFICQLINGAPGTSTICKWKDNKKGAWTMSIDDNQQPDIKKVMAICKPRNLGMTWFLIVSWVVDSPAVAWGGNWGEWRKVSANGFDIGSHTVNHPSLNTVDDATLLKELRDSKAKIDSMVPNNRGKCIAIAWPNGATSTHVASFASRYYIAARGVVGAGYNPSQMSASPSIDTNNMNYSMWNTGTSGGTQWVDSAISYGGWGNNFMHQMGDSLAFVTWCNYLKTKSDANLLWASGTTRQVAEYIYERNASTIQIVSTSSTQIVLNLTHTLSTAVTNFTFPLTLKTEVASTWDTVTVKQGTTTVKVKATTVSGLKYVFFDAIPKGGQITLSTGATGFVNQFPVVNLPSAPSLKILPGSVVFTNLPDQATVNLYSLNGTCIQTLHGSREISWNIDGTNGSVSPRGMYLCKIFNADGCQKTGSFIIP
jgi:hypothetical protein